MKVISRLYLFMFVAMLMLSFSTPVFASDLDSLGNTSTTSSSNQGGSNNNNNNGSGNDSVTDYLKGYTPVTDQNMSDAKQYASPITNILGTATGFIVMVVSAAIFVVTALDLCYIGLPFTRNFLNPQAQGGGSPMGGMSPMGGSMGGGQPQGKRWVSDEAVACVSMANPQGGGGGMSPMGGMGMSPMGGMGMGGSMGGAQQQPTKSVIMTYLKKRAFFLIIFAVATILLTSSIFTDCGINLAELSFKVLDKINSMLAGVSI